MALPADIARIRHVWQRHEGDAWTSAAFRSPVVVWLDSFLTTRGWAKAISVVEKFHEPGLMRRRPFGPTGRAEDPRTIEEGFRQSDALPVLVFTAVRAADLEEMEVAIDFPDGALTGSSDLDYRLGRVLVSLDAEEARRPLS